MTVDLFKGYGCCQSFHRKFPQRSLFVSKSFYIFSWPTSKATFQERFHEMAFVVDRAQALAQEAANEVVAGMVIKTVMKKAPKKVEKKSPKKVSPVKKAMPKKKSTPKSKQVGTWWAICFKAKTSKEALKEHFHNGHKKGLKMDAKNFASRLYHLVDDNVGREEAQKAHAEALQYSHNLSS